MCNGSMSESLRHAQECCKGGRLERFTEPCLLLLLFELGPAHGYQLIQELGDFGFEPDSQDPGLIYRHLRRLEKENMVRSRWETEGSGPARRLYELTKEGLELLESWSMVIEHNMNILSVFLERFRKQRAALEWEGITDTSPNLDEPEP